jgi:hypothetical protein
MGWFDWFKKPRSKLTLTDLSSRIAYKILPRYAFKDYEKLKAYYQSVPPSTIGPKFYAKACEKEQVEGTIEDSQLFRANHGFWDGGREYFAMEYPAPKTTNVRKMTKRAEDTGLAPVFSLVVREGDGTMRCFTLAVSSQGETTLQEVTLEGVSVVGPGPEPRLSALLEAVAEHRPWRKV